MDHVVFIDKVSDRHHIIYIVHIVSMDYIVFTHRVSDGHHIFYIRYIVYIIVWMM